MPKTKQALGKELSLIEAKINSLVDDFVAIKKKVKGFQKKALAYRDNKKILELKNKIASL